MATVRIYKVAELLNTTSQEVMALLKRDHGIEVKSASSTIEEVVAREFVTKQAGRSLEPVGPEDDRCYQFAHKTLLQRCQRHPDIGGEPRYRNRLYAWAEHWREQGWPATSVRGPGTPRYLLDITLRLLPTTQAG